MNAPTSTVVLAVPAFTKWAKPSWVIIPASANLAIKAVASRKHAHPKCQTNQENKGEPPFLHLSGRGYWFALYPREAFLYLTRAA